MFATHYQCFFCFFLFLCFFVFYLRLPVLITNFEIGSQTEFKLVYLLTRTYRQHLCYKCVIFIEDYILKWIEYSCYPKAYGVLSLVAR